MMKKNYTPYSLFACAIEEVSKCYRFSRQDWHTYVKNIDYYYPVGTSCLSTPDFDVHCERNLPASKRQRLYAGSRKFLRLRKKLMEIIFDALAESVVNFQDKDNIRDLNLSAKVRARYIKYARILTKMHKLDVMVKTEDNVQNLLRHIQEERARVKWVNKFAYEASITAALMKAVMYNFGGGEWATCNIGDGVSNNTPGGGHNKYENDNIYGNQVGGGDIIDDTRQQTKRSTSKDGTDKIVGNSNKCTLRDWPEEVEDDESISLYGMICA